MITFRDQCSGQITAAARDAGAHVTSCGGTTGRQDFSNLILQSRRRAKQAERKTGWKVVLEEHLWKEKQLFSVSQRPSAAFLPISALEEAYDSTTKRVATLQGRKQPHYFFTYIYFSKSSHTFYRAFGTSGCLRVDIQTPFHVAVAAFEKEKKQVSKLLCLWASDCMGAINLSEGTFTAG